MHYTPKTTIASPVKKKRTSTNVSGIAKYHFCFSPIDMRSATKMYSLVEKLMADRDVVSKLLKPTDQHSVYLYMDKEHLTHIDFNGEDWTCAETDKIFDEIRAMLRANSMYFAFTNYKED